MHVTIIGVNLAIFDNISLRIRVEVSAPTGKPGFVKQRFSTEILKKYAETPKQYAEIPFLLGVFDRGFLRISSKQIHPKQINPTGFKRFLESSMFPRCIRFG